MDRAAAQGALDFVESARELLPQFLNAFKDETTAGLISKGVQSPGKFCPAKT